MRRGEATMRRLADPALRRWGGRRAPVEVEQQTPTSRVTSYTVYPTDYDRVEHPDKPHWCLTVANAGDGWAIRRGSDCLNYANQWEHEPPPKARDASFLRRCRYNEYAALLRARRLVDTLAFRGVTFAQLLHASITSGDTAPTSVRGQASVEDDRAPRYRIASYTVYPSGFDRLCSPDTHRWCLTVADAGDGWAIRKASMCLNRRGEWELEPVANARDAAFLGRCRFERHTALARARQVVDRLTVRGLTFDEFVEEVRAEAAQRAREYRAVALAEQRHKRLRWFLVTNIRRINSPRGNGEQAT
jgi:hypothetical protein